MEWAQWAVFANMALAFAGCIFFPKFRGDCMRKAADYHPRIWFVTATLDAAILYFAGAFSHIF